MQSGEMRFQVRGRLRTLGGGESAFKHVLALRGITEGHQAASFTPLPKMIS